MIGSVLLLLTGCTRNSVPPGQTMTPTFPLTTPAISPSAYPGPSGPPTALAYAGPPPTHTGPAPTARPTPNTTPTPPPNWLIIIPPLVSPGATVAFLPIEPPIALTPAPTIQLAPDRYQAFVQALGPLPSFPPGKTRVQRVEVQTLAFLSTDVNQDGQEESIWVYLIRPYYEDSPGSPNAYPRGYLGLALFDSADRLLWLSRSVGQERDVGAVGTLRVTVEPVALGTQVGVLYNEYIEYAGNGMIRGQHATLYQWDLAGLKAIWQGTTYGGGNQGAGLGRKLWAPIEFRDVDAVGWPELLQQYVVSVVNSDDRPRRRHYQLHLPGALAFRWDGDSFVPAYLVQDDQLTAVRPQLPLYLAPRLSVPITLDGSDKDWWQIEYREDTALRFNNGQGSLSSFNMAWDSQYLYVTRSRLYAESFSFALDTDLAGDLETNTLNQDDFVWSVTVSSSLGCQTAVKVRGPYPVNPSASGYRAAFAGSANGYQPCTIELAIPLDSLGLVAENLVNGVGWAGGSLDPHDFREYHPRAGRAIGFAMEMPRQEHPCCTYDWDDPTTWSTLVFTADR